MSSLSRSVSFLEYLAFLYSFAIILYEVHGRRGPFGETALLPSQMLRRVAIREAKTSGSEDGYFRPPLDQLNMNCYEFVKCLLRDAWSEEPLTRPDFKVCLRR